MGEGAAAEAPKRKRGRPPKPESEKAATKRKAAASEDGTAPKRGRGRPKGSKNKPAKKTTTKGAVSHLGYGIISEGSRSPALFFISFNWYRNDILHYSIPVLLSMNVSIQYLKYHKFLG